MDLPVRYDDCTPTERAQVRAAYILQQGGKCHFCGDPLSGLAPAVVRDRYIDRRLFPRGFFKNPIHLHHDRTTGLTKGAVHARCNAYLWVYRGQ